MRCIRILPDTWARTLWPLSITTRNIALGSGSTTLPCTSIASSLLMLLRFFLSSASWTEAQCGSGLRCRRCSEHDGSRDLDSPSDRREPTPESVSRIRRPRVMGVTRALAKWLCWMVRLAGVEPAPLGLEDEGRRKAGP